MTYTDQTSSFRSLVAGPSKLAGNPSSRSSSRATSRSRRRHGDEGGSSEHEFLQEAYRIHRHLSALATHLDAIRKPYLSLTEPPLSRRRRVQAEADAVEGDDDYWGQWDGAKYLTDRDREEIDLRAKMILRRCRERVGILEDGEKARQQRVAPPPSIIFTLLPSLAPKTASVADATITAHRAAVILTLSTLLSRSTAQLSALQEERSKRRAERSRTLGEGAEREAKRGPIAIPSSTILTNSVSSDSRTRGPGETGVSDASLSLSPAQIQAFESENNALLTHLESTLTSVLSAETSLAEISQLQTQLIQQLVQQTEMVDLLYEQAVGSVGEVKGAEQQLKKAKERGGEARLFLLVFLIGASLALLFLDWYS